MYPNRYICAVFDDMRACYKTLNFSPILSLIEEAQSMANRMEAALEDYGDIKRMKKERHDLHKEIATLNKKLEELEKKSETLSEN